MKELYFLGIGGTAMGSVAGALAALGRQVTGSDSGVYPPMSDFLASRGIQYFNGYSEENIRQSKPDLIIVGNAISRGNPELELALEEKIDLISLPEFVGHELIKKNTSIVVSGTHGKTTTTSILAWLLDFAKLESGFLIGGIHANFGLGCRPSGRENGVFVTEGDEYDSAFFDKRSKFLHYRPDIAVINNIEFDHADIFASLADIELSFARFVNLIPRNGALLYASNSLRAEKLSKKCFAKTESFGLEAHANWQAVEIDYRSDVTEFSILKNQTLLGKLRSPLFGEHNVRNVLAATAAAMHAGVRFEQIQAGLLAFQSPKRRLEILLQNDRATLIDDFAHHPTAIRETLKAVGQRFPGRRIVACFEPRSNTTTRNFFQKELSECFEHADVVIFGPVNRPERYALEERLDTAAIVKSLEAEGKIAYAIAVPPPENYVKDILAFLKNVFQTGDVIVVLSNGGFGGLHTQLKAFFS
ncbi:UDP-N-acetylmuramate:L-alanyl-gamma-D-glutamyl-meso-diaminopimelate ligase [Chloroherpeton thalassium]|uniref:UDP-N-acetylmuramate:L-alanyl-gamma-D-glutamyl- meso-diaminopimelate ligase n=1 Tax=Chloroherpeton thalassium TaxID=100716 RepID=UPI000314A612|nr:UDP-N-acetylmuramate:L-alanyl-gamma-D-glutamyl-meso-diaminopimelate ligase [Chloroherpeton thalassium]